MRQGQQNNKRMRGRGRKMPNGLNRVYESNGPDVKIRGTAAHVAEKYLALSRDANASGDPVAAENYMQHAEHYLRVIAASQPQQQPQTGSGHAGQDFGDEEESDQPLRMNGVAGYNLARQSHGEDEEGDAPPPRSHQPQSHQGQSHQGQVHQNQAHQNQSQSQSAEDQPAESHGARAQGDEQPRAPRTQQDEGGRGPRGPRRRRRGPREGGAGDETASVEVRGEPRSDDGGDQPAGQPAAELEDASDTAA